MNGAPGEPISIQARELTKMAEYQGMRFERLSDGAVMIRDLSDSTAQPCVIPAEFWPVIVANMAGWTPERQKAAELLHEGQLT